MKFDIACLFFTSIALLLVESQGNAKSFRKLNRKKSTPKRVLEDKGSGKGKGKGVTRTDDDTTRRNDDGRTDDETRFDDGEISNDDVGLQAICGMFNDYQDQDLKVSNDINACEPFYRQSDLLCPSPYEGGKICDEAASNETSLLTSIKENYCIPLLDALYGQLLVGIVDTCINSCVHYLSPEHGDCCDFGCID
jgi:hypothetical protein